jgi:hypothetical protein
MKIIYLVLLGLSCNLYAQLYTPSASEMGQQEAQELFKKLQNENKRMDEKSECFQRAHMWALRAEREDKIIMEKVFLLFTYKFQMFHRVTSRLGRPFTWWFHVAPAVRVNGELVVMDPTFVDSPVSVNDWARSLMKEPEDCLELHDKDDYVKDRNITQGYKYPERAQSQCYYVSTSRFIYQPWELGFREINNGMMKLETPPEQPLSWAVNTLFWGLNSYRRYERSAVRQELGF